MSAVDDIAAYLAHLKTGGNRIDQIIFDELPNGEEMTATEELRRLLDGRGVAWRAAYYSPENVTEFKVGGIRFRYIESSKYDDFCWIDTDRSITPQQAVDVTLGKRERVCRDESGGDPCLFICSYCDAEFNHPEDEPINYCPNCGRKVVDA